MRFKNDSVEDMKLKRIKMVRSKSQEYIAKEKMQRKESTYIPKRGSKEKKKK
jgi:hypothetical protein